MPSCAILADVASVECVAHTHVFWCLSGLLAFGERLACWCRCILTASAYNRLSSLEDFLLLVS
jgi:hypothetical protein